MRSARVIAEIANSHEGDFNYAKELVKRASCTGCHAIKLQVFGAEELLHPSHPDFGEFSRLSLGFERYAELAQLIKESGKAFYADVFGLESANAVLEMGVDGVKIHSSDLGNHQLIRYVAERVSQLFLGTGGCRLTEIADAIKICEHSNSLSLVLVTGTQSYPTDPDDLALGRVCFLATHFGVPVCLADHVDGESPLALLAPVIGVMLGAEFVEKHLTLDRGRRLEDDLAALHPDELDTLCEVVARLPSVIGDQRAYRLYPFDHSYRQEVLKKPVTAVECEAGGVLKEEDIRYQRVQNSAESIAATELRGKKTRRRLEKGKPILAADLELKVIVILAARMSSSRLPRKAMKELLGMPSIALLMRRLQKCRTGRLVFCTSTSAADNELAEVAQKLDVSVFRGAEDDVLSRYLEAASSYEADVVVRCTGDNLFIDPQMIDQAVEHHLTSNSEYTKVVNVPEGADFEVISTAVLDKLRRISFDTSMSEYLTLFLDRQELFKISTWKPHDRTYESIRLTLDLDEDYTVIRRVIEDLGRYDFSYAELTEYIDRHHSALYRPRTNRAIAETAAKTSANVNTGYDLTRL